MWIQVSQVLEHLNVSVSATEVLNDPWIRLTSLHSVSPTLDHQ